MPRKTTTRPGQGPTLWEVDQMDLQSYVDSRLAADISDAAETARSEPAWFAEAFDASWPLAFAQADAEAWEA